MINIKNNLEEVELFDLKGYLNGDEENEIDDKSLIIEQ